MSDIFLSYAKEDKKRAEIFVKKLQNQGWSVWWDPDILPGYVFRKIIQEQLDAAKCVIVLWSEKSVVSEWVIAEADEGKKRGILVPVLIDDVKTKIPLPFNETQRAKLIDWHGELPHPEFDRLTKSITEILSHSKKVKPAKNEIRKSKEKVNKELIDLSEDAQRLDIENHKAKDTIKDTKNNIENKVKAILENSLVLFIGEKVSEISGVQNFGDFIIEIIKSITKCNYWRGDFYDFDELRSKLRSESAFKILHDEIGDDILICFEEFIKYEPNRIHYYIANEIKKGKWVFTTNRDDLIEKACKRSGVHIENKMIYEDDNFGNFYKNIQSHQPPPVGYIFKLNGNFDEKEEEFERFRPFLVSLKGVGKDLNTNKMGVLRYFLENFDFCVMGYNCLDDSSIYQILKNASTKKGMFWFDYAEKPIEIISAREHLEDEIKNEKSKSFRDRDRKTLYINNILLKRKFFSKITGNWIEIIQNAYLPPVKKKEHSIELPKLCERIDDFKKNIILGRLWEECLSKAEAITCFKEAENVGEGENKAKAKLSLARVYDRQYGKSMAKIVIEKYQESFEIYEEHGIISEAAQCKIELANFTRRALKDFNKALKECEDAKKLLKLVEKEDNEKYKLAYAKCLNCLGLIHYSTLGSEYTNQCDKLFEENLEYRKQIGDIEGEAETENAIGLIKRNKEIIKRKEDIDIKEINNAIYRLKRALVINESIGDYIGAARNYRNLGLCYTDCINLVENETAKEGYFDLAKKSYESAIASWDIMKGDPPIEDILEYKYRLGELEVNYGEINEGITLLQKVEEQWHKIGDWHNSARSLDLLCKAYNSNKYTDSKGTKDVKSTIDEIMDIYENVLGDDNKLKQMKENKTIFDDAVQILERTKKTINDIGLKDKHILALRESDSKADDVDKILEKLIEKYRIQELETGLNNAVK